MGILHGCKAFCIIMSSPAQVCYTAVGLRIRSAVCLLHKAACGCSLLFVKSKPKDQQLPVMWEGIQALKAAIAENKRAVSIRRYR